MARTKQPARKNASPYTPPSSSSSYHSIERSPSPPPRPTSPHTSSASPSSNTNSESDDSSDSCPPVAKTPTQPEPQMKTAPTAATPPPQHPSTTTKPSTPSKSAAPPPESSLHSQPSPPKQTKRSPTPLASSTSTSSASEPSPPAKKPKQTNPPLISPAKTKIFQEKWAQRPIGIGRIFVFDNLVVDGNAVQHHTDVLGWTSFLKISESYFPDVVRAFYCNAKTFADKSLLISTIKGVEIKLTPDILATILQLPTEGPSVFGDHWYSALGLRKTEVLADLFEEDSTRYLATYLKPLPKVFNNMCQHTLIPHCGSHEYVYDNDALLIHHLLNCKRLNLPYVILQHMICAAKKDYRKNIVPYGMVLTKIFRHFGVSLASEKSLIKISKFSTKFFSHMRKASSAPTPTHPSCATSIKRKRSAGILFHSHHLLKKSQKKSLHQNVHHHQNVLHLLQNILQNISPHLPPFLPKHPTFHPQSLPLTLNPFTPLTMTSVPSCLIHFSLPCLHCLFHLRKPVLLSLALVSF
uniref:Uncharacterized protein LOC101508725 n=1 Tax=Cicer arietinum TaxID=3827 RepID=A0A1S2XKR1_CICAR|nr:uncharacterized protein LOC101508725 [Cicer arietinum]